MNVTIDKFGRIILPKSLRQILGLTPGKKVNIQVTDDGFIAKPIATVHPILIEDNGILIVKYVGGNETESKQDFDFNGILQEIREERTDKFLKTFE